MSFAIHPQREYLVALLGLAAGGGAGLVATMRASRSIKRWVARVTIPLLLAAAGGHLGLIPFAERQHQMLFGPYVAAILAIVVMAMAGRSA